MSFVQKIYYNNKPLILTDDKDGYLKDNKKAVDYIAYNGANAGNYRQALKQLDKAEVTGTIVTDTSAGDLQKEFYKLYRPVNAGGGVVKNEVGNVLMIYRRGKWDLPKGKQDEGEDIADCAVREVSEETGLDISKITLLDKICDTYHVYSQNKQNLLKCTAWYNMQSVSTEKLVPQAEERITEVKWIAPEDLDMVIDKSYEAIREVLLAANVKW